MNSTIEQLVTIKWRVSATVLSALSLIHKAERTFQSFQQTPFSIPTIDTSNRNEISPKPSSTELYMYIEFIY